MKRIRSVRTVSAQENAGSTLFEDDFQDGFGASGPEADWVLFGVYGDDGTPLFVGDDGNATTSPDGGGLRVVAPGANPKTGEPAFTKTMAPEDENRFGLPGGFDHVKWLAFTNRLSIDPSKGNRRPQTFVDEQSRESSRLFGQGAELRVQNFAVESRAADDAAGKGENDLRTERR